MMTAPPAMPRRRVRGLLGQARSDTLVRNSLYLMASTVVTAGLGYVFWIIAAHAFTSQEVGAAGAVISLCSTVALLTYLGSSAVLIERLPARERSPEWTIILVRTCVATAGVTVAATAAAVLVLLSSRDYRAFFSTPVPVAVALVGAAAWTLVSLFNATFMAARRGGRILSIQTLVSASRVLFVLPLAAAGTGAAGLVGAWVASGVVGVGAGAGWLIPRMGLGRRPAQWRLAPPSAASVRHMLGQHLTSVGGAVTPLVLPVLVVLRLGITPNAYFYITWMLGGVFFMVSPSVATALFAEGVRARSDLRGVVGKALWVITVMLAPAMVAMVVGGRLILGLFGASYAAAGYELLVLLAISALPDAVSNIAVAVLRVAQRLRYSALLNLGTLIVTLVGAWLLMPPLGIPGVGVAWLGAQMLGAVASLPALAQIREPVTI